MPCRRLWFKPRASPCSSCLSSPAFGNAMQWLLAIGDEWIVWRRCDCAEHNMPPHLCFSHASSAREQASKYIAYYFYCSRCVAENIDHSGEPTYINADGHVRPGGQHGADSGVCSGGEASQRGASKSGRGSTGAAATQLRNIRHPVARLGCHWLPP